MNQPSPVDDWTDRAACKGQTEVFFVNRGDTTMMEKAKAICANCPVLEDCRNYVLYRPERYGIWAGMTEKERRRYRIVHNIRLPAAAHGSRTRYLSGCRCKPCRVFYNRVMRTR